MADENQQNEVIIKKLDCIIDLLRDLFILEATKVKMNKEALRAILRIDKRRIGRIAKHVKASASESDERTTDKRE